jgi:putative AdoMet-dependent methyltransferase
MVRLAQHKLPAAHVAVADVRAELPAEFRQRYDRIVSGYTFHHFPLEEKVGLVRRLMHASLLPGGRLVIGDLAFASAAAEAAYAAELGDAWEQEYFWRADEALTAFGLSGLTVTFTQVSPCAGVFQIPA